MKEKLNTTIKTMLYACFLVTLTLSGCSKSEQGIQGIQGEQGITGADSSTLLSGNGAPSISLGKNGDYYLDKTAAAIYGPKTASGWGSATSLKGERGDAGSKILSGTTVPSSSLGAIGDFYFDTKNIAIYGPKTTNGWGDAVSLKNTDNGIRTFIYSNQKIPSATLTNSYNDGTKTYYSFEGKLEIVPPVTNYQDYYENGLVLVFLRNKDYENGVWINGINSGIYGSDNYAEILTWRAIRKDKIIIEGRSRESSNNGGTYLKSTLFDVKVVLVPTGSVTKLSSVNTKDLGAVERALGLK